MKNTESVDIMPHSRRCLALWLLILIGTQVTKVAAATNDLAALNHIIVIFQENWSFDSLYPSFPGANGLANASSTIPQMDKSGKPITVVPQPLMAGVPDSRFPTNLPVGPYDLTRYAPADQTTGDLIVKFYHEQLQIDNGVLEPSTGSMDKFVSWSDNGGLVFSYIDSTGLPEGLLAQKYGMCDNFFHSAYGGSFLNHQFLVAAAPPYWSSPPTNYLSNTNLTAFNDNVVTPDGYVVNTAYPADNPHPTNVAANLLLPPLTNATIGDRLTGAGISWKWYSGGWSNALAGTPDPLFQFHHQPFAYYANYGRGTAAQTAHLQDEEVFYYDLENASLPAVSFIKPIGQDTEHPGYANEIAGQLHVADLVAAVQNSPYWKDCAIIITYDENGGRWDHVTPPQIDRWGLGTRIPAIIISPFAKRHYVDHTQYETVSILKLIENRFGLEPLASRDANPALNDLSNAFDFSIVEFEPVVRTTTTTGDILTLSWTGIGRLQSAPSPSGPWTVLGATNGSYSFAVSGAPERVFRVISQ